MGRSTGHKSNGKAIEAAERQRHALELRKGGSTFAEIAEALGYKGPQGAHDAVRKAIAAIPRQAAEDVRMLEMERLDRMLMGLYDKATRGHEGAVDRVLRIMDRRARYLGLDVDRREVSLALVDDEPRLDVPDADDRPGPIDAGQHPPEAGNRGAGPSA